MNYKSESWHMPHVVILFLFSCTFDAHTFYIYNSDKPFFLFARELLSVTDNNVRG